MTLGMPFSRCQGQEKQSRNEATFFNFMQPVTFSHGLPMGGLVKNIGSCAFILRKIYK